MVIPKSIGILQPSMPEPRSEGQTVEVTFGMEESEFFLVAASEAADCEITLELVVPRSDGLVLEFLSIRGTEPSPLLEILQDSPRIKQARLLEHTEDQGVFELVVDGRIAQTLADHEAVVTGITAKSGAGRLVAEIPPHIDANSVIKAFLAEYPGTELLARRETDRGSPALTQTQFVNELLESLTEKQLRALRVAYGSGYFAWPREVRAEELAEQLDIATPTFAEHLRAGERKVFGLIFDSKPG